ncbi:hypothetical protein GCM10010129_72780 [Streptomyces fumigatiscleroticus]|nr:hypothetical protein GCM10010129_72780 [Streptomyces fumigatiscleroticus]
MDPIALAAGTAMVGAMATDAWCQARTAVVAWWNRLRPEQVEGLGTDLDTTRGRVLTARESGDTDTEQRLATDWQDRLQRLLLEGPATASDVRRLLDEALVPVLPAEEQVRVGRITMRANASGRARVYQAGRDQHITER